MPDAAPGPEAEPMSPAAIDPEQPAHWGLTKRIAFRFCFCYFLPFGLNCIFIQADILHHFTGLALWKIDQFNPWQLLLPWIGSHIFHLQRKIFVYPESDFLSGYLQHLAELIIAIFATVTWSILDRKRPNYRRLYAWFTLYLRSMLAITLFGYGFDKVFPLQFGELSPDRLARPMGQMDMFNVLWAFMAASVPYTVFSGALEVTAGVLLLVPSLEMPGAFLAVAVMSNVFLLNMDYGVSVKLFSSHLLLVSLFLAAPGIVRVAHLLVLRRTTAPIPWQSLSNKRWIHRSAHIGMVAFAAIFGLVIAVVFWGHYRKLKASALEAQSIPFYGAWEADSFFAGETQPPAVAAPQSADSMPAPPSLFTPKLAKEYRVGPGFDHWIGLNFNTPDRMTILLKDGVTDTVDLSRKPDPATGQTRLADSDDAAWKASLSFAPSGKDVLSIQGVVNGVPIAAKFHRIDTSKFPLTQEKFRWIQDEPGN